MNAKLENSKLSNEPQNKTIEFEILKIHNDDIEKETVDYIKLINLEKNMTQYFEDQKRKIEEITDDLNNFFLNNNKNWEKINDIIINEEKLTEKVSEKEEDVKEKLPSYFYYYCDQDHRLNFVSKKKDFFCYGCHHQKNDICKYECQSCSLSFCLRCRPPKLINGLCPSLHRFKEKLRFFPKKCDVCTKKISFKHFLDENCSLEICTECKLNLNVIKHK